MICPTVRRVTAAVALASALWLAAGPAAAAPRAYRTPGERAVPQAGFLDQFLQWLETVWAFQLPGTRTEQPAAARKSVLQPGGTTSMTSLGGGASSSTSNEQGGAMDPNGKD